MKATDKIKSAALELFNAKGSANVTFRDIAAELEFSPGHLFYHFKKKEHIIEALYDDLVVLIDEATKNVYALPSDVPAYYSAFRATLSLIYDYRFIMMEMPFLMQSIPSLRRKFKKLLARRSAEFKSIFGYMKKSGMLRSDLPGSQYEMLFRHFFIISNLWVIDASVFHKGSHKKMLGDYTAMIFSILVPYLPPKMLGQYQSMLSKIK
jgi:AcrR family transcriptional regulator